MTLMKDNEEEILRVVRTWVSRKHKSFPNWSQDELLSEAWLAGSFNHASVRSQAW